MTLEVFRTTYLDALNYCYLHDCCDGAVDAVVALREQYPAFYKIVRDELGVDCDAE